MKRVFPLLFLLLPAALFAQSPATPQAPRSQKSQETALLKSFGLTDAQVAQVFDIQDKTKTTLRQDTVQLRLLRAQMDKALLPDTPNMNDVNGFITQMAQTRADVMKSLVGARVQLKQIIGTDNFPAYSRFIRQGFDRTRVQMRMRRVGPGSGPGPMMGPQAYDPAAGDGGVGPGSMMGMMGPDGPMMSLSAPDDWQ
jgi:Spy/CpxP family protein refolding chaperone